MTKKIEQEVKEMLEVEYAEHKRCRRCKQETSGIEEFYSFKNPEKLTKSCNGCRERSREQYRNNPGTRNKYRKPTQKEKIKCLTDIVSRLSEKQLVSLVKDDELEIMTDLFPEMFKFSEDDIFETVGDDKKDDEPIKQES